MDGKVIIGTELDTKNFEAQINRLEDKLDTLEQEYATALKDKDFPDEELKRYASEIEQTKNKIISLRQQQEKLNDTNKKTDYSKLTSSLKRFGLAMFGIQSIYRAVSRASSSYLSQDIELAEKLRSVWVGLGSFMEPVLQAVSNGLLTALGYLNEFVKALTGVDFIARANAKALQKQAQAQKNLNKQNYDFDVIRTQQDTSTSGSTSASSGLIQIPELDDRIVKKLQKLAITLKDNWWWIKKVGIALLGVFGAVAIAKFLSGIGGLLGSAALGTGLLGLQAILVAIAGAYVISMYIENYKKIKQEVEDLKKSYDNLRESIDSVTEKDKKNADAIWEAYNAGKIGIDGLKNYKKALDITADSVLNQVTSLEKNKTIIGGIIGTNKELTKTQQGYVNQLNNTIDEYKKLYETGAITKDEYNKFTSKVNNAITTFEKSGLKVDELKEKLKGFTQNKYTVKITASLKDEITSKWNQIMKMIDKNKDNPLVGRYLNIAKSLGFKGFALGGIVTQPTRALIGEAGYPEAVVPMTPDYLSTLAGLIAQYGGSSGNGTVNVYLDGRLIERQISNRQNQKNFVMNR